MTSQQEADLSVPSSKISEKAELQSATFSTHIDETTNVPPSSVKRKWSVTIVDLPKKQDAKKFQKLLDSADISYIRAKKVYGVPYAKVTFADAESREAAKKKLLELKFNIKEANDNNFSDMSSQSSIPSNPLSRSILDVVTPWHTLPYNMQLERKTAHMEQILKNITESIRTSSFYNIPAWLNNKSRSEICCPFEGVKPSPMQTGYRNKVEYTIGYTPHKQLMIGFLLGRVAQGYTAVADPSACSNVSPLAEQVRQFFLRYITQRYAENKLEPYDKLLQRGFWRLLTVRTTLTSEAMAVLQYNPTGCSEAQLVTEHAKLKAYLDEQNARNIGLVSVYTQSYSGVSNAAPPDQPCDHLWGDTHLYETLLGVRFRISPKSFFQVNTRATEVLYTHIREFISRYQPIDRSLTVLDICSGIGTIGLTMAREVKQVIGIELVSDAVQDAIYNAQLNDIRNVKFVVGKAEDVLQQILQHDIRGKCVAVVYLVLSISRSYFVFFVLISYVDRDPPRAGLHNKTIRSIRACPLIEHVVYVSCNQNSLVNDAAQLCRSASNSMPGTPFIPITSLAVDLFPSTEHCEALVLFQRYNHNNSTNKNNNNSNLIENR
jgi:tRNA (uracil-5-)-methyltransferase